MKAETRMKIRGRLMRIGQGIKEMLPSIAVGTGLGMIVGGYFGTIANSIEIKKTNQRLNAVAQQAKTNCEVINQHADAGNAVVGELRDVQEQVQHLQEQNNLLMERALKETKGEG